MEIKISKKLFFLLLIISSLVLITSCKYSAVGVSNDLTLKYESGAFIADWVNITDKDDIQTLEKGAVVKLDMSQLTYNHSVDLVMLKPKKLFKRKTIGINCIKIELPKLETSCIEKVGILKCNIVKNSKWFQDNFSDIINDSLLLMNDKSFLVFEREIEIQDEKLRELVAIVLNNEHLHIFEFYSIKDEFEEHKGEFLSILRTIRFDKDTIKLALDSEKSGFFYGILHGFIWLFRWAYSWYEYYDVWPDNNNGVGYIIGFIFGIVLSAIVSNSTSDRGN